MAFLFRCDSLSKSFGHRKLFQGISISFDDGERTGLVGPNGSGKSTLLKVLAGLEHADTGELTIRRNLQLGYLPQADLFKAGLTIQRVMTDALDDSHLDEHDRDTEIAILLDKVGFYDSEQVVDTLSGGWRKRLAIARAIVKKPDVLLLDEPTNHLDLEGIEWLEKLLSNAPFAFLLVSHDRYFLENTTNRTVELNAAYADGYLSADGAYSDFLVKKTGPPCRPGQPGNLRRRQGPPRIGMAQARRQSPHHQGQGAHPTGRAIGRATVRSPHAQHAAECRPAGFCRQRPANAQAALCRENLQIPRR